MRDTRMLLGQDNAAQKNSDEQPEEPDPGKGSDVVPRNEGIGRSRKGNQGDRKEDPDDSEYLQISRDHKPEHERQEDHPARPQAEAPKLWSPLSKGFGHDKADSGVLRRPRDQGKSIQGGAHRVNAVTWWWGPPVDAA
jgi:hypothetical protein